jgi:8-oxo-dGTP pyrophosphatase MutT (NUDIX family)
MKRVVTILFLRREGEILLAMKKRGFGVDKWNGAGGKVDPGETVLEGAIRECQEEIEVTPKNPKLVGRLTFYYEVDPEFCHHAHIFVATDWDGEPHETEEMRPQWFAFSNIPYRQMWADDELWLPLLIEGKKFKGSFTVDNDRVVQHNIEEVENV